jgi:hypothetical protein
LETAAKLLISLEAIFGIFSKCTLKSLDNQTDFDSAIPRFESWRPARTQDIELPPETVLFSRGILVRLEKIDSAARAQTG